MAKPSTPASKHIYLFEGGNAERPPKKNVILLIPIELSIFW
jgi:hypothetical protein